jgi:hypothetical protein
MITAQRRTFDDSEEGEVADVQPAQAGGSFALLSSSKDEALPVRRPSAGRIEDDGDDGPSPFRATTGSDSDDNLYEAPVRTNTREDEISANRRREIMLSEGESG